MREFSVLMSIYSKENVRYFDRAMASIWDEQTIRPNEIILVEDGRLTDDLYISISQWKEKIGSTFKTVPLKKNFGLGKALNIGLKECNYKLIARMDTDDISVPNRFQIQVDFMECHPDVSVSSGVIEEWNEDMTKMLHMRYLPMDHESIFKFAKSRCPISHPAVIYRKSAIQCVGGYPDIYPEDYSLWSNLLQNGFKFGNTSDVLVKMRVGEALVSRRGLNFLKGEIKIFKFQKQIGFINSYEFFRNISQRLVLRLSPVFIKRLLYRFIR